MTDLFAPFSLNIKGKLVTFTSPQVMGIVNVTPDSFYANSRTQSESEIRNRVESMIAAGVSMIDIGAYSSRPGADDPSEEDELSRLELGVKAVRGISKEVLISVDTFRSSVARTAVCEFGADIVNDISGGTLDPEMFTTVAELNVPYVLMHMRGTPKTMQSLTEYRDVTADIITDLSKKIRQLRLLGVADIIVDPGFGFSKTVEQNYELLRNTDFIKDQLQSPLLVGISRKSMIYKPLVTDAAHALNGTTVLNTIALLGGASILRVHDVDQALEAVKLIQLTFSKPL